MGQINLEPLQATASTHWSLHNVRIRVRVRVRVEWSQSRNFVFATAAVDNVYQVYWSSNIAVIHMLSNLNFSAGSPCSKKRKRFGFSVGTDSLDTHGPAPAVSASPVAHLAWNAPSLAVCCSELSLEHSI